MIAAERRTADLADTATLCETDTQKGTVDSRKVRLASAPPPLCETDDVHRGGKRTDATTEHKKIDKQSWDYALRSGLAGGLAGCAAKTAVGPLDRVKILFQASNPQFAKYSGSWLGVVTALREINRSEGARGLFRGHSATLLRIFPYAAIKFVAYEQYRAVIIPDAAHETPLRRLVSGSLAGITSVFFTYPLEVIRVRLAFETKKDSRSSVSRICREIYNETPAGGHAIIRASSGADGAAPKLASSAATVASPFAGLSNFYRGFSPTLVGMLPYAGMSFLTHDTVGDWLRSPRVSQWTTIPGKVSAKKLDEPSRPQLTTVAELFAGGLAGLVSQTASYPFEVVRRRMQVSGAVGNGERKSMLKIGRLIWAEKGISGFFVGLGIGYVKVVPMVAISFFVYERGKTALGI